MSKKIPSIKYALNGWDINLPSVRAFTFQESEILDFEMGETSIPMVFDTNIISGCNTNCKYCSTLGGKSDVRYSPEVSTPFLTDFHYKDLVKQLGEVGVKTFFICSNGEPLLNPQRFLKIIENANDSGVRIITYTNGTTLEKRVLKNLYKHKVSLVMKLESLNSQRNDEIIVNDKNPKKSFSGYKYVNFKGRQISKQIIEAYDVYGSDSDMLALETMITKCNIDEVLEIRRFAYEEFGSAQFLKHLYPLGYVLIRGEDLLPEKCKELKIKESVYKLDAEYGFKYPFYDPPDHFSYDARRLINNLVNRLKFPFRIFAHERGGVYHNSTIIPIKFGFGSGRTIKLIDQNGSVNVKMYFNQISDGIISGLNDKQKNI